LVANLFFQAATTNNIKTTAQFVVDDPETVMIDDDVLDEVFDFYTIADQHLTLLMMPIHLP